MDEIILKINNLNVEIKDEYEEEITHAVNDLNLDVYKGKTLGIIGESGSGKSVTALSVMGLQNKSTKVISGSAFYKDIDLIQLSDKRNIYGKEISMIFQDPTSHLNPLIKVGEQVSESLKIHLNLSKTEVMERTKEAMLFAGLTDVDEVYNSYPNQLSGGMKQRAMIASAIILNPSLIIADEPTTALDQIIRGQIIDLFLKFKKEKNMSMIFISHDFETISHLADDVAVMYKGYVMEWGRCEDLIKNPAHPYTKALLKSIPSIYKKGEKLYSVKDDDGKVSTGCPFANRCEYQKDICLTKVPAFEKIEDRHIRCVRHGDLNG